MAQPFTRTMNANSVYGELTNLVNFFRLFDFDVTGNSIVDKCKVDGFMYGDTRLYRSFDVDGTYNFSQIGASGLLAEAWMENMAEQSIVLNKQRQTTIMTAALMEKQAWDSDGAFSNFTTLLLDIINKNKRLFETGYVLTFLATMTPNSTVTVDMTDLAVPTSASELESYNRIFSQRAATVLADFYYEAKDNRRDLNGYGYIRSYDMSKAQLVWNYKFINKFKYDTTNVFHKDDLLDEFMKGTVVTSNYISDVAKINAAAVTVSSANSYVSLIEFTTGADPDLLPVPEGEQRIYPGNFVPVGTVMDEGTCYQVDNDCIGYIFFPEALPFMTGYEVKTSFEDADKLRKKDYITWAYNTLEYLKEFPFVKIVQNVSTDIQYTVTLNYNYESSPDNIKVNVISGDTVSQLTPTRQGYTFDEWTLDAEGTTAFNFATPITGNTILYAQWTA